jgi:hypothetical protein
MFEEVQTLVIHEYQGYPIDIDRYTLTSHSQSTHVATALIRLARIMDQTNVAPLKKGA